MPKRCCISKLTAAIPTQQHNPMKMGFPPVLTNLTISVLRPIAAIAMMMKNLLSSFKGLVIVAVRLKTVVTTDARTKKRMKKGKIFFKLTLLLD